ncbi:MAG: hypothetical protein AMJ64_08850 [Betaproteobacteria bacterium SG8_39]|nr:MAG: hypothetical protein AMJ64_08850 [Betaproteobacteria bacterium SG8_39]
MRIRRKTIEPIAHRGPGLHQALRRAADERLAALETVTDLGDLGASTTHPDVTPHRNLRVHAAEAEAQPPDGCAGGDQLAGEGVDQLERIADQTALA